MPDSRSPINLILAVLLGASVTLNGVLLLRGGSSEEPAAPVAAAAPEDETSGEDPVAEGDADAPAVAAPTAMTVPAKQAGWTLVRGDVESSLARTFQLRAGEGSDALASVYTRLFVWHLDLRRDLQNGDEIAVAWRTAPDGMPEIGAASLASKKLGKTVAAYRWQAPGDPFPSYWHLDGTEAPLRLKEGPVEDYEQITSLLKDRPTHKGMDFKAPVGTEVRVPRAGVVTRANWNWGANGNCIEVRYDDGVLAKFLHLSENRAKAGDRVAAGQVIALTGNTGRSTAPHLHYQLDRNEKTLDPIDYHGTVRRSLNAEQVAALRRDVSSFESMLAEPVTR